MMMIVVMMMMMTSGVRGYATCCSAPSLSCVTKTSSASGLNHGDSAHVECDAGYVMTGCNSFSPDGMSGGAFIQQGLYIFLGTKGIRVYLRRRH